MNGLHPPLTSVSAHTSVVDEKAKATDAYGIPLYLSVSFYFSIKILMPFGNQSVKSPYCFDCLNVRKSQYFQGVSQFKTFGSTKSNTIF